MKLFYTPGTCSLAVRIVLHEAGLPFEGFAVDLRSHQLADGSDFLQVNAKGYVPYLVLDNGEALSEGPIMCQYIADSVPEKNLIPAHGTMARYRVLEWQNFIATELHKSFMGLFLPSMPEQAQEIYTQRLLNRLVRVDEHLANNDYLMGDQFTVADAYLFVVSNWAYVKNVDISGFKHLLAFRARMAARPTVMKALQEEGLA